MDMGGVHPFPAHGARGHLRTGSKRSNERVFCCGAACGTRGAPRAKTVDVLTLCKAIRVSPGGTLRALLAAGAKGRVGAGEQVFMARHGVHKRFTFRSPQVGTPTGGYCGAGAVTFKDGAGCPKRCRLLTGNCTPAPAAGSSQADADGRWWCGLQAASLLDALGTGRTGPIRRTIPLPKGRRSGAEERGAALAACRDRQRPRIWRECRSDAAASGAPAG